MLVIYKNFFSAWYFIISYAVNIAPSFCTRSKLTGHSSCMCVLCAETEFCQACFSNEC